MLKFKKLYNDGNAIFNTRTANSIFSRGGVSCSADSFVVKKSSDLLINICGKKPVHRKSANVSLSTFSGRLFCGLER
jgi:hypothetical protein